VRRYWPVVLIAVLLFGAAGAYVGHQRKPVYEATASLSVGLLDLTTQSVPGFAVGGEVVAGGYSRSVQTDAIVVPVARQLRMTPSEVRGRVSSTPVPNSPIFTITADGSSAGEAIAIANAVSRSMIAYGRARSNTGAAFSALLDRYRQAVRRRNQARSRVSTLRSRVSGSDGSAESSSPSPSERRELAQARADLATQQLRVDSIGEQYRARAAAPGQSPVVQRLVDAAGASSDRTSKTQLYGAIGALGGLCLGTALAVFVTAVGYRRRRRRVAS
jgi:uncharacterized protein involved in exopolysaccharide biosynthesis